MTPLESHALAWPLVFGAAALITAAVRVIAYALDAEVEKGRYVDRESYTQWVGPIPARPTGPPSEAEE